MDNTIHETKKSSINVFVKNMYTYTVRVSIYRRAIFKNPNLKQNLVYCCYLLHLTEILCGIYVRCHLQLSGAGY